MLLLRVPMGRWEWIEALQLLDYIPKGKRNATTTICLREKDNTEVGALKAIILYQSPKYGGSDG